MRSGYLRVLYLKGCPEDIAESVQYGTLLVETERTWDQKTEDLSALALVAQTFP